MIRSVRDFMIEYQVEHADEEMDIMDYYNDLIETAEKAQNDEHDWE